MIYIQQRTRIVSTYQLFKVGFLIGKPTNALFSFIMAVGYHQTYFHQKKYANRYANVVLISLIVQIADKNGETLNKRIQFSKKFTFNSIYLHSIKLKKKNLDTFEVMYIFAHAIAFLDDSHSELKRQRKENERLQLLVINSLFFL